MKKSSRLYQKIRWQFIPSGPHGDLARGESYRKHMLRCGNNFKVGESAFIFSPELLEVGDDVYVGFSTYLGNGSIVLGNQVLIGNHVSITPSNHLAKNGSFRFGGSVDSKIFIGDGAWIAAHSCILSGVSIGAGSLVAAGSVVTKSIPERVVVAGVPARIIKDLAKHE